MSSSPEEVPDSNTLFKDTCFIERNQHVSDQWVSIRDLYPGGTNHPLLPETFSREHFGQGNHYECFMLSALATLVRFPDVIRNCFVTKKVRQDGRYTFQFFRGREWVKVEIDDRIAMEEGDVLYVRSPTEHWWPLLLEKAYAKFYTAYDHLEGCTLLETFHDLTGNPVLNIPMDAKLAKSAGVDTNDGPYWLSMGDFLLRGDFIASALTRDAELEGVGIQSEQQYAILGIFTLTGSSALDDIVVHLHNPFEDDEYQYTGPMNKSDTHWTAKQRQQYSVNDSHSIFLPLKLFLKFMNSIQFCYMRTIEGAPKIYEAAWKGQSAGGNPTCATWRQNPLFLVRNEASTEIKLVVMIQQEDQRRFADPDVGTTYVQCGLVVSRFCYPNPIPTFWVTGNSHKPIHKSLFLNSREMASAMTIPPNSLCYLVPSCMHKGSEGSFMLFLYHLKGQDYGQLSVEPTNIPGMNWASPATQEFTTRCKEKQRVDFYVDEGTDIHILMHQTKPYVSKSGGDAMAEDYMGMYLYDDMDRYLDGVHAATNFREISIIHRLSRSGRYAVSITCPRAKAEVPAYITIVGSHASNVRIVDAPADATMFDDEDIIDEGEDADPENNPIDYTPVVFDVVRHSEQAVSDSPFEDKRFYMDNRGVTSEPWVHIGDLYPEGKTRPLLPTELSRDQFEQGDHYNCSLLTAFAALLENHPGVIRNCFISTNPRKDGRYTFQFHRYGQWVKVEIDDRIPMVKGGTVFCRSPTHHWWPLLLEKAYAKFYTLYDNLESITQDEVFHDFTGQPCLSVSTDAAQATVNMSYFDEVLYWSELAKKLPSLSMTALTSGGGSKLFGLINDQYYAVLDIILVNGGQQLSDVLVKMYNPYVNAPYTGPMNAEDVAWTNKLKRGLRPEEDCHTFYIPANNFVTAFSVTQMGFLSGLSESRHFNSEWGEGTNGGDTSLISWRENPLYVFSNPTNDPVQLMVMVRRPDQRHRRHTLLNRELAYPRVGLSVAQAHSSCAGIPTHLVTLDNHRFIHRETPVAVREVANVVTIPPKSLCYVVGHCSHRIMSKFILSYWFMKGEDCGRLEVQRYLPKVAKHQPAIAHVALFDGARDRVDFVVDIPTEVHALLRQEKPVKSPHGGDTIAEDYVGIYLYNHQNEFIKGIQSAMNYREVSLVAQVTEPGHYVLLSTCPRGTGDVPCRVEIAVMEEAHVRIPEASERASALDVLDLSFLDACPEGIALSTLPLDSDSQFQADLAQLRSLLSDSSPHAEVERLENRLNQRAHELAKALVARDRPVYLAGRDLNALNPVLDADEEYMSTESELYNLKQDPRNYYKLVAHEDKLRHLCDKVHERFLSAGFPFIEARPEGIPLDDIPLTSDEAFIKITTKHARLGPQTAQSPSDVLDLESQMRDRAREMARAMHDAERTYLEREPEGVPLELLPLNTDDQLGAMEDELRALHRTPPADHVAVAALQAKVQNRVSELARELRRTERTRFLVPQNAGIIHATLDEDPVFRAKEVVRLRLLHDDPVANATAIAKHEEALNERAAQHQAKLKATDRAFLTRFGIDVDLLGGILDEDPLFCQMEDMLREMRKHPSRNAAAIKSLEEEMMRRASETAAQYLADERSKYLKSEYEGRSTTTLPLNDDAAFCEAESAYLKLRESGQTDPATLRELVDAMRARAAAVARGMNVADRPKYLPKHVRGVPLGALPLDDDDMIRRMSHARARALNIPGQEDEVAALEQKLRARVEALASAYLAGDREFLDQNPEGIPLSCLSIDVDDVFRLKEEQRAALRLGGQVDSNKIAITTLEESMNQQVHDMAKKLKTEHIRECVPSTLRGLPRELLPLMTDNECSQIIGKRAVSVSPAESTELGDALRARARELADGLIEQVRSRLADAPLPLSDLPLDSDKTFKALEYEAVAEWQKPSPDQAVMQDLVDALSRRARELAEELRWQEREAFMVPSPEGRALRSLPLNADALFLSVEARHRAAVKAGASDSASLRALEEEMRARAQQLALEENRKDRLSFMPASVRGILLHALPLDDDAEFRQLEKKRATAIQDPNSTAATVASVEDALRSRANAIAQGVLMADRAFLDPRPEGVPIRQVPIDSDHEFQQLEEQRAQLCSSAHIAGTSSLQSQVVEIERRMNGRARELAKAVKARLCQQLEPTALGISLQELPLDVDPVFNETGERFRDALAAGDSKGVAAARDKLNARATELADAMHKEERAALESTLEGVPLEALPLNRDALFLELEKEARAIRAAGALLHRQRRDSDAAKLANLTADLNERARALANESRLEYCDAGPGRVPLAALDLASELAFLEKEAERRELIKLHGADSDSVRSCNAVLKDMQRDIERCRLQGDRDYLDKDFGGVDSGELPLDDDVAFHLMEVERTKLKLQSTNASLAKATALEGKLNERANALAQLQREEDFCGLNPTPHGVPLAVLQPHSDSAFAKMVKSLRVLKRDDPFANADKIRDLQAELDERCHVLAKCRVASDRAFLDAEPGGVPLALLPLDQDAIFLELESKRANLKSLDAPRNAAAVRELETKLNERVHELAKERIAQELDGLSREPLGIPLEVLRPYEDSSFQESITALRSMRTTDISVPTVAPIKAAMEERCQAMARDLLEKDRGYLHESPRNVPLSLLPLSSDEIFHAAEVRRLLLKAENPRRHANKIAELESRLNFRAMELAEMRREQDLEGLDPTPEGLPLRVIDPHADAEFAALVDKRRALEAAMHASQTSSPQLAQLLVAMNRRSQLLARNMLKGDRGYMEDIVEGIPLEKLPLDADEVFHGMEVERALAMTVDPQRNVANIKALEGKLIARAHELAGMQKEEDLRGLDPAPCGIPLVLLNPHEDGLFAEMLARMRESNGSLHVSEQERLRREMNERAVVLAHKVLKRSYLDPNPEGVPLEDLPLEADRKFHSMEIERAKLKLTDARHQADVIRSIEAALNERASELAKLQRAADLGPIEDAPLGLTKELLGLHSDAEGAALINELRELRKSPNYDGDVLLQKEAALKHRALELAGNLLAGDRTAYIDPRPRDIPIEDLPLDQDEMFHALEVERATMKIKDSIRNAAAVRDTEVLLNDRAYQLAELVMEEDLAPFPPSYHGILTKSLKPHSDRLFSNMAERRRLRKRVPTVTFKEDLEQIMDNRLSELALEQKDGDLYFLHPTPHGVPLLDLPLDTDKLFSVMRQRRQQLKKVDPVANREAVSALEDDMNGRAAELARDALGSDFDGVDQLPLDIPLDLLQPREDAEVARLISELRRSKLSPQLKSRVIDLQAKLNERVLSLAATVLENGRDVYLHSSVEGVPVELLPLNTDEEFHGKEVRRAILWLEDPIKNADRITELESQLSARIHELSLAQKEEDLNGVDTAPRGIPLAILKPHEDAQMSAFIKDMRVFKADPVRNADNIRWRQQQMNQRAHELADMALNGDRNYLTPDPLGVPLSALPLDTDLAFHTDEVARAVAKRVSQPDNQTTVQLEQRLNARLEELAAEQLRADVENLEQAPLGVPLSLLKPHAARTFAELLPELRRLAKDPVRNAAKLAQLRATANERIVELAEGFLEDDRPTYLDAAPGGVPLSLLPLTSDDEFRALEKKRLELLAAQDAGGAIKQADVVALEEQLNKRAHELAKKLLRQDRGYLAPFPEGVPLEILPFDSDTVFGRLEATRALAKGNNAKTQVSNLEDQLNARARELALAQKEEDLRGLHQHPRSLPLRLLHPHRDAHFKQLVDELRKLKASQTDQQRAIEGVHDRMNDRCNALAEAVTKGDRNYLHPKPEGVPLIRLPLDTDAVFQALEVERAGLKLTDCRKNQRRIAELEDELNMRTVELARATKAEDLKLLSQNPHDVPVEVLNLHMNPKFCLLIDEKEQLPKGCPAESVAQLVALMNECALEEAEKLLHGDRGYLGQEPEGVPRAMLPLDTDAVFHKMEVERAVLKARDPVKNAATIRDLEGQLNERLHELASAALALDRGYLHPKPEGVSIDELPLDVDSKFHSLEVERAKLKGRDAEGKAARMKELEVRLNDRAVSLAIKQLEKDLQGLDQEPEGYPLKYLRPHSDETFAAAVASLRKSRMEKPANMKRIHEIQATLNARARVLARERIAADRAGLDPEPRGVRLALLPLDSDSCFAALEAELRMLKASDKRNANAIAETEGRMNDRALALAEEYVKQSRTFLDQEPEGVPLADVPLDDDAEFCAQEKDRLRLVARGASFSPTKLREIEEQLNDRAHVLAGVVKVKGREFLRGRSSDIPKELLALDSNKTFVAKERELRGMQLRPNTSHLSSATANLYRELQLLADEVGEAQLKGNRDKYLDVQPEGVDLCDIPLDTDYIYHGTEVERAILLAQGAAPNSSSVRELEKKLNARAHELAHQIVVDDREYLPEVVYGLPVEELPLDTDAKYQKLERQRRVHKRSLNMKKEVLADEEQLRNYAHELAREVMAHDLGPIKASYRGIPKEDLNLHADAAFCELARRRRRLHGKGRVKATEMAAIEDEMDRRACEIADDVIERERAFLDPEPEGMYLADVPLDADTAFQQLEQEYRRRSKDPRTARQSPGVMRELIEEMNRRSHTLARAAFAASRGFMNAEQEGIPLAELGLDEDPQFREAEIARYRLIRNGAPNSETLAEMEACMNDRARELARVALAADRAFLDRKPLGVPLEALPLDSDNEFGALTRERRRRMNALKAGAGEDEVRSIEERLNARVREMAKEFLEVERAFLSREPEGVPLTDLPLNGDSVFHAMEDERLQLKREPLRNAAAIAAKESDLEDRVHVIARNVLRKERAFLDPEPLGVPIEDLPLNGDICFNLAERKRRLLRSDPKRSHEKIRACEEQMAERLAQIAADFVAKERMFLDQTPEGVPLRYLPLNTDREFHEKELYRRTLLQRAEKNRGEIAATEHKMNRRVHALAKDLVRRGRAFLHPEPCGVPLADVPLNADEHFRKMEEQRRGLKETGGGAAAVKAIEDRLNERAEVLAQQLLDEERSFMDRAPLGIALHDLPLNTDRRMREIEQARRRLRKMGQGAPAGDLEVLEAGMSNRARELADQLLAMDRCYLHPEPCGVPLADLSLHTDSVFHATELERFRAKKRGQMDLQSLEKKLNERVMQLAADFIQEERAYLDQEPEGIPLQRLPLDTDSNFHGMELERRRLKRSGENRSQVLELESQLNRRARELALELRGWQDADFHKDNARVAEQWVRVCDLYPERRFEPFEPAAPSPNNVVSAPQDAGYLAPFIAALSRYPVLLQRLIVTKEAPVNAPYTFAFFDPHSKPVYVDVDDRVPCTRARESMFTQSTNHNWYPLLLEKAYAKFLGGYDELDNCTALETLRDLTGRPVTHTPFDMKLSEAANLGNYMSVSFWLSVTESLERGDVVMCSSNAEVPDGIHPLCTYALLGVIVTLEGSTNPSDVVIKLENSFRNDGPVYTGPLCHTDVHWSLGLQQVCQYDPERDDMLYLPLPTFLRNFSSLQTCHINCGDRLTATARWDSRTSGGGPKFTTFRNNPIFVVKNSSSRPVRVLSELSHTAPQFVDPEGVRHYPQSGMALMEPTSSTAPLTPLITNSTARFLQKGIMLNSREVCIPMEMPAYGTCLLIPHTANVGHHGSFYLSVYPGSAKVSLSMLNYCGLSREPKSAAVTLTPGSTGQRMDFTVSSACDVHVLLRQEKTMDHFVSDKGDVVADDDVVMAVFNEQAMRLASSGEVTNAREHSLVFKADRPGCYTLLLTRPNPPVSGDTPCTVSIFTPKRVLVKFISSPVGARPLEQARLPALQPLVAKSINSIAVSNGTPLRYTSTVSQPQQRQREGRLLPLRINGAATPVHGHGPLREAHSQSV